jgi:AcrR family transcriptional regulator
VPRPKVDSEQVRARFFQAAEDILKRDGGQKLRLTDVTIAVGMTQSNAYRYFKSKDELVAALAERWFAGVEQAAAQAVAQTADPREQIHGWLLATMNEKASRFDNDPETFLSYLELAKGYSSIVVQHTQRLRAMIEKAVSELVDPEHVEWAIDTLEDATVQFRNPYLIAAQRDKVTVARASSVLDAVFLLFLDFAKAHNP